MCCDKKILTLCFVVVVGMAAGVAHADLVGHWSLNDGSGATVADSSGNGYDGTIIGNLEWVAGKLGGALQFNDEAYVDCTNSAALNITGPFSATIWIKPGTEGNIETAPLAKASSTAGWSWQLRYGWGGGGKPDIMGWQFNATGGAAWVWVNQVLPADEWYHIAAAHDGTTVKCYLDGVETDARPMTGFAGGASSFLIGSDGWRSDWIGAIDDVRLYDHGLSPDEVITAMLGSPPELGANPKPENEVSDVLRDSLLSWTPGEFAATHNVYIGTSLDDVTAATVPTASGLDVNSFDPGRLDFGQTYFWRVDEVNGTPDKTVFKGEVWSFQVEPYSIMIPVAINHVTASSSAQINPPEMTINGSGLKGLTHSTESEEMWLTGPADFDPWLMYEFDQLEKLDQMWVWNSNNASEGFIGWGIKDVRIETSVDGVEWTALAESTQLDRAPGLPTYNTPQAIDFGLVQAKFVKLDIQSNWGGLLPQYGLAEVQFYGLPVRARVPMPASGSVDVRPDVVVTWRAGRQADLHTVYVDTDLNVVADGMGSSASSSTNSMDFGSFGLQMGETYYWRVDEVNDAEAPYVWTGPVWSLTTSDALIVDDFESYTNKSPNRPFQAWLDGFGYSADEFFPVTYPGNGTGAGIGHDIWSPSSPYFGGKIMETVNTIAGSSQSMPFYYTNTGGVASETVRTFAVAQDWTVGGTKTLSIAFHGQANNTGTLYVKINNTKLTYSGDASDLALEEWQTWNIDLPSVSTNLQSIATMAIGVDGSAASGLILIDDIQLSAEATK